MAERDKKYLPQSSAGLIRYFDEESKIRLKPSHVVWISGAFIGSVIVLKLLATA